MSAYYLNLVAVNPKREETRSEPVRVLANTGIHPRRKRLFTMAEGRKMERDVGFCILESEGFITNVAPGACTALK
ncbi:MAG TPA: hypothetical protein VK251_03310 [Steroidobacteraceae bacterium]|nr:hypothetical protein [Steroidobacteraceae bacterium]